MSAGALEWVLTHSEEKLGRRLVLLVLADCAKEDGTGAGLPLTVLEQRSCLSRSQVHRCLRELEQNSAIERVASSGRIAIYDVKLGVVDRVPVREPEPKPEPTPREKSKATVLWETYLAMRDVSPTKIRSRKLDDQTRRMIERALEDGSVEEWLDAIPRLLSSSHHVGYNDRNKQYLAPRHVFTKCTHGSIREHLDWLLDLPQTAEGGVASSETDAKIRQAKILVLEAFALAGNAEAQKFGDESEAFLAKHGWLVDRSGDRPKFVRAS